jgi:hypothetical protein
LFVVAVDVDLSVVLVCVFFIGSVVVGLKHYVHVTHGRILLVVAALCWPAAVLAVVDDDTHADHSGAQHAEGHN